MQNDQPNQTPQKLGLPGLVSICVGSMIGAGLFALPQNVAKVGVVAQILCMIAITLQAS